MSIGGATLLSDVVLADVIREARSWSHPAARAERVAVETAERVGDALDRHVMAPDSPVGRLVREQLGRFRDG